MKFKFSYIKSNKRWKQTLCSFKIESEEVEVLN